MEGSLNARSELFDELHPLATDLPPRPHTVMSGSLQSSRYVYIGISSAINYIGNIFLGRSLLILNVMYCKFVISLTLSYSSPAPA